VGGRGRQLAYPAVLAAVAIGYLALLLPAVAGSEPTPSVKAVNIPATLYTEEAHEWSPRQLEVSPGSAVTFENPTEVNHGIHWTGGPETPVCSGVPVGEPEKAGGPEWHGTCTFARAGVYNFVCTIHHSMTGKVVVSEAGTTTTTTTTTPGSPPTTTVGAGPTSSGGPGTSSAALLHLSSLGFGAPRHGHSVHGAVTITAAGAGGRLEVDLFAKGSALGAAHSSRVRVGRLVRTSLRAGALSFSIPISLAARHALTHRGRLALSVRIVVTPTHGPAAIVTRGVTLHA
jgi:plastocyanin